MSSVVLITGASTGFGGMRLKGWLAVAITYSQPCGT